MVDLNYLFEYTIEIDLDTPTSHCACTDFFHLPSSIDNGHKPQNRRLVPQSEPIKYYYLIGNRNRRPEIGTTAPALRSTGIFAPALFRQARR